MHRFSETLPPGIPNGTRYQLFWFWAELPDIWVEREMTMPFHGRDQPGEDGVEAFATDAIGGLPEDDERLADGLGIDRPADPGFLGNDGIGRGEKADRMLAVTAGDVDEIIEDLGLIDL